MRLPTKYTPHVALALLLVLIGAAIATMVAQAAPPSASLAAPFFDEVGVVLTDPPEPSEGFHYEIVLPFVVDSINPTSVGVVFETIGHIETYMHFGFPGLVYTDADTELVRLLVPGNEVWFIAEVPNH